MQHGESGPEDERGAMFLERLQIDASRLLYQYAWGSYGVVTFGHSFTRQVAEESFGGWFMQIQRAQHYSPSLIWLPEWHPEDGLRIHFMVAGIGSALQGPTPSWNLQPKAFNLIKFVPYFDPHDGDWYQTGRFHLAYFVRALHSKNHDLHCLLNDRHLLIAAQLNLFVEKLIP
jgi:hypothetical protein